MNCDRCGDNVGITVGKFDLTTHKPICSRCYDFQQGIRRCCMCSCICSGDYKVSGDNREYNICGECFKETEERAAENNIGYNYKDEM